MSRRRVEIVTHSEDETLALGRSLGALLEAGAFLGFEGPLGAGKTRLIQGICEGLGVDPREVTSPTYALVNTYAGRLPVYHLDLYRISDAEEVESTGVLDLSGTGVVLVEWIDQALEILPPEGLRVTLDASQEEQRALTFASVGEGEDVATVALLERIAAFRPGG